MYIDFNGTPDGAFWSINQVLVAQDFDGTQHTITIYPDIQNDNLRLAGKPMHFYIMPESVRMAKNDQGKYIFHFIKFAGVLTQDSNIAVKGQEEVAGGVVSFTSTLALPPGVIESVKDQIKQQIKQDKTLNSHPLFTSQPGDPPFEVGFVQIEEAEVYISNLTLDDLSDPTKTQAPDDQWLWRMQGGGAGSIDPNGTNACSAMLGQFPAALVEAGFKGESSSIFVHEALKLLFRTPNIKIKVHVDYASIYSAFSANTKYRDNWTQENIKRACEESRMSGMIKGELDFGNLVLSDKEKANYEDMLTQALNSAGENVQKYMFDKEEKPPDQAEAADPHSVQHNSALWGLVQWDTQSDEGFSFALNSKFDASSLQTDSEITIQGPYRVQHNISTEMKGFFQEISKDPKAVNEYFSYVNLGDAFKKIHVIATSRGNWPDAQGNGDPLDKLTVAVGYPDQNGVVGYKNSGRYYTNLSGKLSDDFKPAIWTADDKDTVFVFDFAVDDDVAKAKQNQISIKRTVTYKMDPRVKINPDNEVAVPDETTSNTQIEVKADLVGHLNVGPINLAADLNKHMLVEVTFIKDGFDPTTILFTSDNIMDRQKFELWTNETGTIAWSYKVKVTYKSFGPLDAIVYEGDEVQMTGSYARGITINLPKAPDNLLTQLTDYKTKAKEIEALDS